jgi:adenylate cyclase
VTFLLIVFGSASQACVNTLAVRHLIRPFQPGDTLQNHAVPMTEVMSQLQAQLAEFKALKEQLSIG